MRILVVCDVLFPQTVGGAGRVAREVSRVLEANGHQVHFFSRRPRAPFSADGDTTYYPAPGRAFPGHLRQLFRRAAEEFEPDLVHVHQPLPAFLSIPAHFQKPIVYTFHSSWAEEFKIKSTRLPPLRRAIAPILAGIEGRVLARAAAVNVLSAFSQRELRRLYGRDGAVIPGGVDSSRFRPAASKVSGSRVRLISLRNLVPRMGLPELIRAMALLPAHFTLEIGGEGPLKSELQGLIQSLGLGDRVRLAGHVPDGELPNFYSSGDWFLLPTSALEGFGLVILESLACGTPVLGTRIGAIPELLARFDPAWIIDAPSPQAIAATVMKATARQPFPPEELHQRIAGEFDWEKIAEKYVELFKKIT